MLVPFDNVTGQCVERITGPRSIRIAKCVPKAL